MGKPWSSKFQAVGFLAGLFLFVAELTGEGAEKTNTTEIGAKPAAEEGKDSLQDMRLLQLQEQMHSAIVSIEQARQEADAAAKRNAEAIAGRLKQIEHALTTQRDHEMESMQSSNRLVLTAAGVFAGIGLLAVMLTSLFQVRAMHRLAEIAAHFSAGHSLSHSQAAALRGGDTPLLTVNPVERSGSRLLGTIEQLEKRVHELEHTARPALADANPHSSRGLTSAAAELSSGGQTASAGSAAHGGDRADRISMLLGKGQVLLSLDQPESALTCFEDVIAIDSHNTEALVKKGSALERMKRWEEAVECYDRAIAVNDSLTVAYLCKGGVFNQLERFSEALQCYEQALRTQHKPVSSPSPA